MAIDSFVALASTKRCAIRALLACSIGNTRLDSSNAHIGCAHRKRNRMADMKQAYDQSAPKKPTNLSVNSDLLSRARSLKLNLSSTLETALAEEVRRAERIRWLERNQKAIDASNELAKARGLFADSYRII